jgi:[ribosomal protein S5]-alanine N-acetyltransferase
LIEIESLRLLLVPLDHRLLSIWYENGREAMTQKLQLKSMEWEAEPIFLAETADALENFWIPQTKKFPDNFFWYTNWEIVLKNENVSVGGIGFAGYPDEGNTQIGYFVDKKFRNLGIATEALNALLDWGFMDPSLKTVLADTEKHNIDSQKVLIKNGFKIIGEGQAEHTQIMEVFHWEKPRH